MAKKKNMFAFLLKGGAEREQGLLQILTEMDGFKVSTSQVYFFFYLGVKIG